MTKEQINEFTYRITNANSGQMVVVLYDMELAYIEEALTLEEDKEAFVLKVRQAQKVHQELMNTLSYEEDAKTALDVMALYLFVNKKLVESVVKRGNVDLEAAIKVLEDLRVGFEAHAKLDQSQPLMQNSHQVYAGLTYGKGYLNESYDVMAQQSRGFKAQNGWKETESKE